jgi:hypothetical protein
VAIDVFAVGSRLWRRGSNGHGEDDANPDDGGLAHRAIPRSIAATLTAAGDCPRETRHIPSLKNAVCVCEAQAPQKVCEARVNGSELSHARQLATALPVDSMSGGHALS